MGSIFLKVFIIILGGFLVAGVNSSVFGQNSGKIIQFSGRVVAPDDDGDIMPLPYVNVAVEGTSRGTVTEYDGFFSLVAKAGEKVVFSRIGYKTKEYIVPDTLRSDFYSWIQVMSKDSVWLDEVVIMPWPSREHFKYEFLAIDISNELREQARENLAAEVLAELRYTVPADGRETTNLYIRETARDFIYTGQFKPQRVFDVVAWKQFIEAWRRGDFKSKKDKKN
jgi:hypothetical protein